VGPGCATSTIRCMPLSRSCARLACAVRLTVPSLEVRATLSLIFREGTQGTVSTENRSPGCGKPLASVWLGCAIHSHKAAPQTEGRLSVTHVSMSRAKTVTKRKLPKRGENAPCGRSRKFT